MTKPRQRLIEMPASQQAGILCNTDQFARFVETQTAQRTDPAIFLRAQCGIISRRELDTNPTARATFDRLVTEYDAWRGAIPNQR